MALDDPRFSEVLADYNQRLAGERKLMGEAEARNDWASLDLDDLLIPIGDNVGTLMHSLVLGLDAQVMVELGTSYGYSTLFFAEAARTTGGRVYSYDVAADKQDYARRQLERAGLAEFVEFRLGDAVELLLDQPGPVDFVLIDLWKDLYVPCLHRVGPLLRPGGMILADNMTYPPQSRAEADAYMAAVRAMPDMESILLPHGSGIDLSIRTGFR